VPGVPARVPVPLASAKVTPEGNVPDTVMAGAGLPVAVTVKVPEAPTVNVVELPLVMAGAIGAALTVRAKLWVAAVPTPLLAVIVIG
jgi:hypothetical protein